MLLQIPSILKRLSGATSRLLQDSRSVNNREPLYQKQGKIPQAHRPVIEKTLDSWIRLGLIRKADSMFNTPLFCLQHPDGYRIVQDFRALNCKQHATPLKFKEVHETLHGMEMSKPKILSTLDLSDLAWQINVCQEQEAQTAFTVPGQGQFQWNHRSHRGTSLISPSAYHCVGGPPRSSGPYQPCHHLPPALGTPPQDASTCLVSHTKTWLDP